MKAGWVTPLIAVLSLSAPAVGQQVTDTAANPSEIRLSPEQVEQVLAETAERRAAAERKALEPEGDGLDLVPPIYGELGLTIGTGGYRSAYGSAVFPMGEQGSAAISFSLDRSHEDSSMYWDWGNRPPNR